MYYYKRFSLTSSDFSRPYSQNLVFDFFSFGYLDVSVPQVTLSTKRIIRKSNSGTLSSMEVCSYLKIIAAYRALHRYTSQAFSSSTPAN